MSKKKWGYVVVIRNKDQATDEGTTIAAMEAIAISPRILGAGRLDESEELAASAGPMMMGAFIEKMGDQNVLSFKKKSDLTSIDLLNAQISGVTFSYATLGIVSLSKISSRLHGINRLVRMFQIADAYVDLLDVSVTFAWVKLTGKPFYDLISLRCKETNIDIKKSE